MVRTFAVFCFALGLSLTLVAIYFLYIRAATMATVCWAFGERLMIIGVGAQIFFLTASGQQSTPDQTRPS